MKRHPMHFTNLVDWVDGRLDVKMRQAVEAHLAMGCPVCQKDLAWLQRVIAAARADDTVEPPVECVARAKALYRSRVIRLAEPRRVRFSWAPRLVLALAALVLVVGAAFYMSRLPTLFAREATLTALEGSAQVRRADDTRWQTLGQGGRLHEGDQVRVADGKAVLTLFEGSVLKMQAGTELALSSLRSGLFSTAYRIAVNQRAGSVDYNVAPLRSPFATFEARCPTVLVTVRGTRFVLTVESAEQTRVTVLEGSVQVVSAATSAVLGEREVAVVPANAPLVHLPTLTPTPTPRLVATETPAATPSSLPSRSPTVMPVLATETPEPTDTVQPTVVLELTGTPEPTATPERGGRPKPTATPAPTATVKPGIIEFSGVIQEFPRHLLGRWVIGGRAVLVTPRTEVIGRPAVGLQARVKATGFAHLLLLALKIEIEGTPPAPTMEPSPTPTLVETYTPPPTQTARPTYTRPPTHTPWPTRTPPPTQTARPTYTRPPTHTPWPTRTPQPTQTARPTHDSRRTYTPQPTPTPTLTESPEPTPTPTFMESLELTATSTPTESPQLTMMAEATATPLSTETPGPQMVGFNGAIEHIPPPGAGRWVIGGWMVVVTSETQIEGTPIVGLQAEVEALQHADGFLQAVRIRITVNS